MGRATGDWVSGDRNDRNGRTILGAETCRITTNYKHID